MADLSRFLDRVSSPGQDTQTRAHGHLSTAVGTRLQAHIPGARIGELVRIQCAGDRSILAEVVGFEDTLVNLLPYASPEGLAAQAAVEALQRPLTVATGEAALGRVLDGLGQPLDGLPPVGGGERPVASSAPDPMSRPRIERPLSVGVRAVDGLLTLGEGQRMGIFAAAGAGKTQLLAQCARQTEADVFVVALVGERGRELREFLEGALGPAGLARGVVVCASSDAPPLMRMKSALTAVTHAEAFRDQGKRVLLLLDSVTRFARAAREVGLAAGETPVRRGYPPSVFAALPPLLERCGRTDKGSITALCTVLVEGDDLDEPVADELRGLLDGHIVLSRELAGRGHFPAIDVLQSLSRCMHMVSSRAQLAAADQVRAHLARFRDNRDLITLGAYRSGQNPALDDSLTRMPALERFLRQAPTVASSPEETLDALQRVVA